MNAPLMIASLAEALTGAVLAFYPPIVIRLLFGAEVAGAGVIISRIAGISLIALGIACWPNNSARQPVYGMLTYSTLAMLYLILLAIGGTSGILLWPGIVVHAIFSALLIRVAVAGAVRGSAQQRFANAQEQQKPST